ncbi:MAG: PaaI family thioesterase [Thermodesulfobacteriota bacterium]|nr:PaaI family thioesterase [Thermodesulfobacteriota bacterium]
MIDRKYAEAAEFVAHSIEAIRRTGVKILEMRDGYAKALMPMESNINHVGIMYAGSLFTIGEISGGIIYMTCFDTTRYFPLVKEITIRFRRPALTDVTVETIMGEEEANKIQAEADEKGKADYALNLEIKDENGEVVAEVKGLWQIRKNPEEGKTAF